MAEQYAQLEKQSQDMCLFESLMNQTNCQAKDATYPQTFAAKTPIFYDAKTSIFYNKNSAANTDFVFSSYMQRI